FLIPIDSNLFVQPKLSAKDFISRTRLQGAFVSEINSKPPTSPRLHRSGVYKPDGEEEAGADPAPREIEGSSNPDRYPPLGEVPLHLVDPPLLIMEYAGG